MGANMGGAVERLGVRHSPLWHSLAQILGLSSEVTNWEQELPRRLVMRKQTKQKVTAASDRPQSQQPALRPVA